MMELMLKEISENEFNTTCCIVSTDKRLLENLTPGSQSTEIKETSHIISDKCFVVWEERLLSLLRLYIQLTVAYSSIYIYRDCHGGQHLG